LHVFIASPFISGIYNRGYNALQTGIYRPAFSRLLNEGILSPVSFVCLQIQKQSRLKMAAQFESRIKILRAIYLIIALHF